MRFIKRACEEVDRDLKVDNAILKMIIDLCRKPLRLNRAAL